MYRGQWSGPEYHYYDAKGNPINDSIGLRAAIELYAEQQKKASDKQDS
jgi:hypothetical protein